MSRAPRRSTSPGNSTMSALTKQRSRAEPVRRPARKHRRGAACQIRSRACSGDGRHRTYAQLPQRPLASEQNDLDRPAPTSSRARCAGALRLLRRTTWESKRASASSRAPSRANGRDAGARSRLEHLFVQIEVPLHLPLEAESRVGVARGCVRKTRAELAVVEQALHRGGKRLIVARVDKHSGRVTALTEGTNLLRDTARACRNHRRTGRERLEDGERKCLGPGSVHVEMRCA